MTKEQFEHGEDMSLEMWARRVFGQYYFHSVGYKDFGFWKDFYERFLLLLARSHSLREGKAPKLISRTFTKEPEATQRAMKAARTKDQVHRAMIIGLMKLLFIVLGNPPSLLQNKRRNTELDFETFASVAYFRSEEQIARYIGFLLQTRWRDLGFEDDFDADYAPHHWAKEHGRRPGPSATCEWARVERPDIWELIS